MSASTQTTEDTKLSQLLYDEHDAGLCDEAYYNAPEIQDMRDKMSFYPCLFYIYIKLYSLAISHKQGCFFLSICTTANGILILCKLILLHFKLNFVSIVCFCSNLPRKLFNQSHSRTVVCLSATHSCVLLLH